MTTEPLRVPATLLALLLANTAAAEPPGAPLREDEQTDEARPRGDPQEFSAGFADALSMRTDRLMQGVIGSTGIAFPLPTEWTLIGDPVLWLSYETSSSLLPQRSHLTVLLNGQPIHSTPLADDSRMDDGVPIPLPRALLQPYNQLEVRAIQHASAGCEDPFDPGLWTRVRNSSRIDFRYVRAPVVPDLAAWPHPFIDETGFGAPRFTLVVADAPSLATIDAVGRIGLALGRQASWRGVDVAPSVGEARDAHTHALVVGLPGENPAVPALLGSVVLEPGQGLIAARPNPGDPTLAVLVVTGADEAGLRAATNALTGRGELLGGAEVVVDAAADADPAPSRQLPRAAPEREVFTLADLGLLDQTVRGFHTAPVRIPLGLRGDARVRPDGGEVVIEYGYAARLDPRLSAMEVRVDGITVRTLPLENPKGASREQVAVDLPATAIEPDSEVDIVFHLFPLDFDTCHYVSDATLWGTVYASTTLRLERDYVAELPDLERLRYGAWPFTLEPESGRVIAALPDAPTRGELDAGFLLAAALGRTSWTDTPSFRLTSAAEVSFEGAPEANFVLLATDSAHRLRDRLLAGGATFAGGSSLRLVGEARELLLDLRGARAEELRGAPEDEPRDGEEQRWGAIEEVLQPANHDRAALILHAGDAAQLMGLVDTVTDPRHVARLSGTLAVVRADGHLRLLTTSRPHTVGSRALGAAIQHAIRTNWVLLGLGIVGGAFMFAVVKNAWAGRRNE